MTVLSARRSILQPRPTRCPWMCVPLRAPAARVCTLLRLERRTHADILRRRGVWVALGAGAGFATALRGARSPGPEFPPTHVRLPPRPTAPRCAACAGPWVGTRGSAWASARRMVPAASLGPAKLAQNHELQGFGAYQQGRTLFQRHTHLTTAFSKAFYGRAHACTHVALVTRRAGTGGRPAPTAPVVATRAQQKPSKLPTLLAMHDLEAAGRKKGKKIARYASQGE